MRPAPRIRDVAAMTAYHEKMRSCEIRATDCQGSWLLSVHHVYPRSQGGDDVEENFVMGCGSGTTGCHGKVEAKDPEALNCLYEYVIRWRADVLAYLVQKLGATEGMDYLIRTYHREL